ncbi:MAG: pyruvate kinase alpha/beta domain-containing protein [Bacillota bacterium]|jgi:hypothetical protein
MYFATAGAANTEQTVQLALQTAQERRIRHMVIASNTGETARLFQNVPEIQTVCVTHVYGMWKPGENEMTEAVRAELTDSGMRVLTATHVLSGAERGISKKFGGVNPVELIAHTLRMFGQGTKVCVEIAVMALDAGLIPFGEQVIAVGGTGRGADTAVLLTPAHAAGILDTRIHEIICKPN